MKKEIIRRIIRLVIQAQELALKIGITNILQPGLVKEMIIAEILGHELIHSKRDADACDPNDPNTKFEYLSCYEGGKGQLDRMFKEPVEKREESLNRIWRNEKIYFAIFYKENPLKIKVIFEIEPNILVEETEKQLDKSRNAISHVGFTEKWASLNGIIVFNSDMNDLSV
jgi:hypothetical protein